MVRVFGAGICCVRGLAHCARVLRLCCRAAGACDQITFVCILTDGTDILCMHTCCIQQACNNTQLSFPCLLTQYTGLT